MISIYFLEFIGSLILAFLIFLFGKKYGHLLLGTILILSGSLFNSNCFNPVIAAGFVVSNKITLINFYYYIILEFSGGFCGYYLSKYIHSQFTIINI